MNTRILCLLVALSVSLSAFPSGVDELSPAARRVLAVLLGDDPVTLTTESSGTAAVCQTHVATVPQATTITLPQATTITFKNGTSYYGSLAVPDFSTRLEVSHKISEEKTAHWTVVNYRAENSQAGFTVVLRPGMAPLLIESMLLMIQEVPLSRDRSFLMGITPEHDLIALKPFEAPLGDSSLKEKEIFYELRVQMNPKNSSEATEDFYSRAKTADPDRVIPFDSFARPQLFSDGKFLVHVAPNFISIFEVESSSGYMRSVARLALPGISNNELPHVQIDDKNQLRVARSSGLTFYSLKVASSGKAQVSMISTTEPTVQIPPRPPEALPEAKAVPPGPKPKKTVQTPKAPLKTAAKKSQPPAQASALPPARIHAGIRVQEIKRGAQKDLVVQILGMKEKYKGVRAYYFLDPAGLFIVEPDGTLTFLRINKKRSGPDELVVRVGSLDEFAGDFSVAAKAAFVRTVSQPLLRVVQDETYLIVPASRRIVIYKVQKSARGHLAQVQILPIANEVPELYEISESGSLGVGVGAHRFALEPPQTPSGEWQLKGPLWGARPSSWRKPKKLTGD
jgi:hypothetical protein